MNSIVTIIFSLIIIYQVVVYCISRKYVSQKDFMKKISDEIRKDTLKRLDFFGIDEAMLANKNMYLTLLSLSGESKSKVKFYLSPGEQLPNEYANIFSENTEYGNGYSEQKRVQIDFSDRSHEIKWDDTRLTEHRKDRKNGVIWRSARLNVLYL